MLVEDNLDHQMLERKALETLGEGTRVVCAGTAAEGLEVLGRQEFELVVVDYQMPGMTGLEFLCAVKERGIRVPVVLVTGLGNERVAMQALREGASDYVIKDSGFLELLPSIAERAIRTHLMQRQLDDARRELAESGERILRMAYYDGLTGLPNRALFMDRLNQAVALADRSGKHAALLFLDIDNFKGINDTRGHRHGDLMLREVAERLSGLLRKTDTVGHPVVNSDSATVGRFGGDEFAIVLVELGMPDDAALVARRILDSLTRPVVVDGHETIVSASIGIAIIPDDGRDPDVLLRNADVAMYSAKEKRKGSFQFYQESIHAASLRRSTLETDLYSALNRNEFFLEYQPQISTETERIVAMEVLIRWHHPNLGLIGPTEFIPLAEKAGLIVPIGHWVLETACQHAQTWSRPGRESVAVAVNWSIRQFNEPDSVVSIVQALQCSGLDPNRLILEITESIFMQDSVAIVASLHQLTDMGIRVSLDDFGIGYSVLNQLKRLPLYGIKIDRSIIQEIDAGGDDATIPRAIISLAHSLRLKVVAEGVETERQLEILAAEGCDEIQGFLTGCPLPADETARLLEAEAALPLGASWLRRSSTLAAARAR